MKKSIVLCADDYGQAPAISKGIITLIKHGRLSATSCLVNTEYWLEHAKWLTPLRSCAAVGLHLNLTDGKPLSSVFIAQYGDKLPSLSALLWKAYSRRFDKYAIAAEFEAQIDRFVEGYGALPDFIDGHQHIHQFPIIRDAFVIVYQRRLKAQKPPVRWVNEKIQPFDFINNVKKLVIKACGAHAFKRLLDKYHIPHNQTFNGIYPFGRAAESYRDWFVGFLKRSENGSVLMCHPGLAAKDSADPIAEARYLEYQYLFGAQFLQDCYECGVSLKMPKSSKVEGHPEMAK